MTNYMYKFNKIRYDTPPCIKDGVHCEDRCPACQDRCEKYNEFKLNVAKAKGERVEKQREMFDYMRSMSKKGRR